ncbi:MAG: FHA domain-containing protein, partial [Myxococcales bacterium]|nr:FHA domain-containing protein [Myxococcales bacterium]
MSMGSEQLEDELTGEGAMRARPASLQLLVFLDGGVVLRQLPASGAVVIGRSRECDIAIPHVSVSRKHAALDLGAMTLVDLGSRNGSALRDEPLAPQHPVALEPGDTFRVGDVTI